MITFWVASVPQPKGSTRSFFRGGRVVTTSDNAKLKPWSELIAWTAQFHVKQLEHGAVAVGLAFVLPRPKSHPKRTTKPHLCKPDVDKLARAVLDPLTGIAWGDDSQVTRLTATKRYAEPSEQPGVGVTISRDEAEA